MSEPKFICCTEQQVAILRCPRCSFLLGYCRSCATLFNNLHNTGNSLSLPSATPISCPNCPFSFPVDNGMEKHLAAKHDLVSAGLTMLAAANVQLKSGPKQDVQVESFRQNIDRIGWDNGRPRRATSTTAEEGMNSRTRALLIILVLAILGGGGYFVYDYIFAVPPPPPPKQPAKGAKPGAKPPAPPPRR